MISTCFYLLLFKELEELGNGRMICGFTLITPCIKPAVKYFLEDGLGRKVFIDSVLLFFGSEHFFKCLCGTGKSSKFRVVQ